MRLDCNDSQTRNKQFLELLPLFPSCITSISILLWLRHLLRIFEHFFNLSRTILNDNYYKCGLTFDVENLRKDMRLHFQALSEQLVDDHHVLSLGKAISDALKNSKRYRIELERFWKHKNGSTQRKGWAWYEHEVQALQLLEDWGPKPIPLSFQVLQACGRSEIHLQKMGARGPPVRSKCWIASFSCRIPFMTHQSTSSLDSGPIPSSLLQRGSHCNLCPFEIASSRTYFWPQQTTSQPQLVNQPQTWDLSCTHPGNPAMIPSSHFQHRIPALTEQIPRWS